MYFLAVNYGSCDGWQLTEFESAQEALDALREGDSFGQPFKILKELELSILEG